MSRGWVRATGTFPGVNNFFDGVEAIVVSSGQTVLHAFWNINIWGSWGSVSQYPPGSSICRAGIGFFDDGIGGTTNTPISQASADWMDITTICPVGQIATSTNVDWQYNWQFEQDREIKVQRKANTATDMGLYIAWEFSVASDAVSGFNLPGWSFSIDAYVNTP